MAEEKRDQALAPVPSTYIKPQAREPHDPRVSFEEYYYYAHKTRQEELGYEAPRSKWRGWFSRQKKEDGDRSGDSSVHEPNLKATDFSSRVNRMEISDEEWTNASRALRTASTGAVFYLITIDILGPYGTGFTMGTLGWGPGIGFFTLFGFMAGYSGYLLWRVFLGTDSYEFPARNYGDLSLRIWGPWLRHTTNVVQALALILLLGQVTIQFGENISEISMYRLCYAVCPVIFIIAGFFITQIRTLRNYGWVANLAVWLNILVIFITMGVFAHSPPNYAIAELGSAGSAVDPTTIKPDAQGNYPPIMHYNRLPEGGLIGSLNGILTGVLAYAGLQLFVEFLAEMRRPRDFIKAMWGAQFFLYTVYVIYGCFTYYYQGQYTFNPSYLGVSSYGWQTVGNVLTLIGALIAGGLYGNIGIKVFYNNVLIDIFHAPPLSTRVGKYSYAAMVPIWWIIAYVIAGGIPDFIGFVSVVAASTLLNLTYTLPPLLALGYDIQRHAMRADRGEGFDPSTGNVIRDGSGTLQRWIRGFLSGGLFQVAINVWHVLYFLASLGMCGLGMYAAIEGLIEVYSSPQINAFSCTSPLNLNG